MQMLYSALHAFQHALSSHEYYDASDIGKYACMETELLARSESGNDRQKSSVHPSVLLSASIFSYASYIKFC